VAATKKDIIVTCLVLASIIYYYLAHAEYDKELDQFSSPRSDDMNRLIFYTAAFYVLSALQE
jgi:hypothetical protein